MNKQQLLTLALLAGVACTAHGAYEKKAQGKRMDATSERRQSRKADQFTASVNNDTNLDFGRVVIEVKVFNKAGNRSHTGYVNLFNVPAGRKTSADLVNATSYAGRAVDGQLKNVGNGLLDKHFGGNRDEVGNVYVRAIHAGSEKNWNDYARDYVQTRNDRDGSLERNFMLSDLKGRPGVKEEDYLSKKAVRRSEKVERKETRVHGARHACDKLPTHGERVECRQEFHRGEVSRDEAQGM